MHQRGEERVCARPCKFVTVTKITYARKLQSEECKKHESSSAFLNFTQHLATLPLYCFNGGNFDWLPGSSPLFGRHAPFGGSDLEDRESNVMSVIVSRRKLRLACRKFLSWKDLRLAARDFLQADTQQASL